MNPLASNMVPAEKSSSIMPCVNGSLAACIILMFSLATFSRNSEVWRTELTAWENVVKTSPNKGRGRYNLGNEYKKLGLFDKAVPEYLLSLKLESDRTAIADVYNNLGRIYEQTGLLDLAAAAYSNAIAANPHHSVAYNNLGLIYLQNDQLDEAARMFQEAIRSEPGYAKAHFNLGRTLAAQGLKEEAAREFDKARVLGFKGEGINE